MIKLLLTALCCVLCAQKSLAQSFNCIAAFQLGQTVLVPNDSILTRIDSQYFINQNFVNNLLNVVNSKERKIKYLVYIEYYSGDTANFIITEQEQRKIIEQLNRISSSAIYFYKPSGTAYVYSTIEAYQYSGLATPSGFVLVIRRLPKRKWRLAKRKLIERSTAHIR
jgi:hypothetical protein